MSARTLEGRAMDADELDAAVGEKRWEVEDGHEEDHAAPLRGH